jgi:hypothetical protein
MKQHMWKLKYNPGYSDYRELADKILKDRKTQNDP